MRLREGSNTRKAGPCMCIPLPVLMLSRALAGGQIEGDIRMNGHPKEQTSFARVSGYVEQNDVHSPQTTVREALVFSAQLRFAQGVPSDTVQAFVDEVMGLVELTSLQHGLVSFPPPTPIRPPGRPTLPALPLAACIASAALYCSPACTVPSMLLLLLPLPTALLPVCCLLRRCNQCCLTGPSACPSFCLSACLYVCLSVCLSE